MALPEKLIAKQKTVSVNFACQRCTLPLKLHASFNDLDSQTLSELTMPLHPNNDREERNSFIEDFQKQCEENSVMKKIVVPVKFEDGNSDFMMVDDLSNLPQDSNHSLRVKAALFEIMSGQSDVDHPLCEECTDNLLDEMDQQLKIAEDECKEYKDFLETLKTGEEKDDLEKLKADLAELQKQEADYKACLSDLEVKNQEVKKALKAAEDEWELTKREEDKRAQEYCRIQRQLLLAEDNYCSAINQMIYAEALLSKLTKTNVFNATFHIWHNGHFGTINSFRLGRLRTVPVEWSEINAAWGQTVLLLHSLAKKINLTFERYRLVPYGNHSYIETLEDKSKDLPLYCLGGLRYVFDSKFDLGMVAFLDCLQQFKNKVENRYSTFHLPYDIEKGKVIDKTNNRQYSIKTQFNSEEQWTKALKFMLTNLKWAVAWVTSKFMVKDKSPLDECFLGELPDDELSHN